MKSFMVSAFLFFVFFPFLIICKAADKKCAVLSDGKEKIFNYEKYGITVIELHSGFEFLFIPKDVASIKSIAEEKGFRFVINASYFDGDNTNASHAGWLRVFGRTISPVKMDRQLTHIFQFDTASNESIMVPFREFSDSLASGTIGFQTGPLVIKNNKVDMKYIKESINGFRNDKRTLLAVDEKRTVYLITVREGVFLSELGDYLLGLPVFLHKNISVINLDGGSSVALYSKNFPELNFKESARLPLLLGIK